jgi:nicotinamidase-related amidase
MNDSTSANKTQDPKTLRQMADAPTTPPPLGQCALIIIDAQHEYLDGHVTLPNIDQALGKIQELLTAARKLGRPIIHVAHVGANGGLFDPDVGGRIIEQVEPHDGEIVVTKTLPNSFANTTLRDEIAKLDDPHLILCGFMTHMCISSTARAALDLGLSTTVISDASGTRSLPTVEDGAETLSHQTLHQASLAALADRFSFVATTAQVVPGS